jgi:hypothetical protein
MRMPQMWLSPFRGILAFSILLCGLVTPVMAQVFMYDDFTESQIDPARWRPNVSGAGNIYEMVRQISRGTLAELLLVNGSTRDDVGTTFGRHELRFVRTDFTQMHFDATVSTYATTGCPTSGSQPSTVFVDLVLTLFNDGSATASNDQTGDITARIEILRSSDTVDPPSVLQARGQLTRCADPTCATRQFIGVVSLGPVLVGQRNTYAFYWDAANQFVAFWKNTDTPQVIPYSQDLAFERSYRALGVSGSAANCTVEPRPMALVSAAIDNVILFVP